MWTAYISCETLNTQTQSPSVRSWVLHIARPRCSKMPCRRDVHCSSAQRSTSARAPPPLVRSCGLLNGVYLSIYIYTLPRNPCREPQGSPQKETKKRDVDHLPVDVARGRRAAWEVGSRFVFSNMNARGVDSWYGKLQQNRVLFRQVANGGLMEGMTGAGYSVFRQC